MMFMNIKKLENINTIKRLLNINDKMAEKIYDEAGTDIDKIYASLKNQKKEIHADKVYTKCLRCGKPLKTLESQICGYGKVCKDKVSKSKKLRKKSFIGRNVYGTDSRTTRFGGEKH